MTVEQDRHMPLRGTIDDADSGKGASAFRADRD